MVCALGTPKRHPQSGIFLFRKRVPERLRDAVGKSEIKFSLQTRDPVVARIRNLEETARLERAWLEIDGIVAEVGGYARAGAAPAMAVVPDAAVEIISPAVGQAGPQVQLPSAPKRRGRGRRPGRFAPSSPPTPRRRSCRPRP
ncbi:DUF6538 domain-containing protein [Bradyrhizobium arachidis]|uniref:DUF6538 domain-containing protein n=1 Tax=Bradyrhizobium arachidis TaxID=858423 RepID=UPI0021621BE9|nr:DUF6538 domain-containing protein [Bradyrhizobium arachidis]UVO30317.1 hypothetical protein KUF59_06130 [Bradyrhizobium arachidis]